MTDIPSFQPKPFVFVLMPFASEFDDIYRYGIKEACEKAGTYAERVDEQMFQGSILDRIYNQIAKADIIIADMTGRNPNVFYETGYAHALGKPVILLTQNTDDIPFDLKHHHHIVYGSRIGYLAEQLEPRVRFFAENIGQLHLARGAGLAISINGVDVVKQANPTVAVNSVPGSIIRHLVLKIRFENPVAKQVETVRFQPAIVMPIFLRIGHDSFYNESNEVIAEDVPVVFLDEEITLQYRLFMFEDHTMMLLFNEHIELLPGTYSVLELHLEGSIEILEDCSMSLRVYQHSILVEYPFTLQTGRPKA